MDILYIHPAKQEVDARYDKFASSSPYPFIPVGVIGLVNLLRSYTNERFLNMLQTLKKYEILIFIYFSLNLPGETLYRGILPDAFLASLSYQQREAMWEQAFAPTSTTVVYVVENDDGQIFGFAAGGPEREQNPIYAGEIYAIYLFESTQRRGIGRQLFSMLATYLAQTGLKGLLVWVAAANPSRHFYAALGGQPIKEKRDMIGEVEVVEIAYGWKVFSPPSQNIEL